MISVCVSRGGTPLPHRRPVTVVVGKPIPVPALPTAAEGTIDVYAPPESLVKEYHRRYVQAVVELYEANKRELGFGDRTLEIL